MDCEVFDGASRNGLQPLLMVEKFAVGFGYTYRVLVSMTGQPFGSVTLSLIVIGIESLEVVTRGVKFVVKPAGVAIPEVLNPLVAFTPAAQVHCTFPDPLRNCALN